METNFSTKVVIIDTDKGMLENNNNPRKEELQRFINSFKINIDKEVFKKSKEDKFSVKLAKQLNKIEPLKNRDEILSTFINSKIPNWNFKFILS